MKRSKIVSFLKKPFMSKSADQKKFNADLKSFKSQGGKIDKIWPIVNEHKSNSAGLDPHYFYQDLLVANYVFIDKPEIHLDIGSSVSGFVAHVASFREIHVLDIRPLKLDINLNIKFQQQDLMNPDKRILNKYDSISCLHTIEHFGLGRYGDKIDPNGHIKGFNNILKLLSSNAKLYISFPVGGIKTKTIFNAHRVFKSTDVLSWAKKEYNLELINFDIVNDLKIYRNKSLKFADQFDYACGIYTFKIK
jgi:hypothetical protein